MPPSMLASTCFPRSVERNCLIASWMNVACFLLLRSRSKASMISGSYMESLSEYKGTSHPLGKGECLKSPGIGIFRFRQDNNLDVSGRQTVLQEGGAATEQQDTIKIGMHADMGL